MIYILLVLFCLCLLWRWRSSTYHCLEPPELSGKLPLVGHMRWLVGDGVALYNSLVQRMSEETQERGGAIKLRLGPMVFYSVSDPEDCLTIANTCLQKHYVYNFARPLFANSLFNADVPTWIKHRKLLQPAFSQHVLDGFIKIFNTQAQSLIDQFAKELGKEFDHEKILRINNLETICSTATGVDADEFGKLQKQYIQSFEEGLFIFNQRIQKFWFHSDFIYNMSSLKKKQDENVKNLVLLTNSIIHKKKCEAKSFTQQDGKLSKFKPFMDLILELTEAYSSFTEEQIRGETNAIIAAGHETTSSALTFAFTLLGSNPQVQNKAYEEIIQVLENSDRNVDKEALSQLVYIEAIIKETLRLFPSAPIIMRQLKTDIKLKNYTLKANVGCILSIYGIQRHKIWGSDANTFRPERWLEKESLPDPKFYAAFGVGRRACIGKVHAMMSMKIILAKVLQKYRISSDVSKMVIKMETTMRPASGYYISLEGRKM